MTADNTQPEKKSGTNGNIQRLLKVMSMLRDKAHGCPWDLEQSLRSLTPHTLEEVYEVVDAVETGDMAQLQDELGDLLFQVVFYAQIANEEGKFDFNAIAGSITDKLLRRHPHVFPEGDITRFGCAQELSAGEVVINWEAIKKEERRAKGYDDESEKDSSLLRDVPLALPAVERAEKLQKRAAAAGFDWTDAPPVIAKLKEEISELETAMHGQDQSEIDSEAGDLLFTVVNLCRHLGTNSEYALRSCNRKFERRFRYIETELARQGVTFTDTPTEQLEQLWNAAKLSEG
ncbi:MAG: nucleoside triphosphate pyrophosphohydrolase [Pseudohongiellaceae bacterium]